MKRLIFAAALVAAGVPGAVAQGVGASPWDPVRDQALWRGSPAPRPPYRALDTFCAGQRVGCADRLIDALPRVFGTVVVCDVPQGRMAPVNQRVDALLRNLGLTGERFNAADATIAQRTASAYSAARGPKTLDECAHAIANLLLLEERLGLRRLR